MAKVKWILFSGAIWFIVGMSLLSLGMKWLLATAAGGESSLLLNLSGSIAGGQEQGCLLLIVLGLMIGFLKGKYVLSKTVNRVVQRIMSLKEPIKLSQVYGKGYLILIGSMMLLGMSLRWLNLPLEVRAFIDIAVGSALLNGALIYLRLGLDLRKRPNE